MVCRVARRCVWLHRSPIKAAIRLRGSSPPPIPIEAGNALTSVISHPGLGVSASIAGRELRLGRSDFAVAGRPISRDYDDAVLLADDNGPIAAFRLCERLRVDAGAAIEALKDKA